MKSHISFDPSIPSRFGQGYILLIGKDPTDFNGLVKRCWRDETHYAIQHDYDHSTLASLVSFAEGSRLTPDDINEVLLIAEKIAHHYAAGGDRNPERKLFAQSKIRLILDLIMDLYVALDHRQYLASQR